MAEQLNDSIQKKARELAERITVAHDLDPEIQEELYGHIEDKMLAYCSGEEPVSQEDALILAREHFGDGATVKAMFQEVHAEAAQVTLVRKLLALVLTLLAFGVVFSGVRTIASVVLIPSFILNDSFEGVPYLFSRYFGYAVGLVKLAAIVYVLRRWRQKTHAGITPWFCRWSILRMATWSLLLFAAMHLMPQVGYSPGGAPEASTRVAMWLMAGYMYASMVCYFVIWFWWTDAFSAVFLKKLSIGFAQIVYSSLSMCFPVMLGVQIGSVSYPREFLVSFVEFRLLGTEIIGYVLNRWTLRPMYTVGYEIVINIVCVLLCALVLQGLYRLRHPVPAREDVSSLRW